MSGMEWWERGLWIIGMLLAICSLAGRQHQWLEAERQSDSRGQAIQRLVDAVAGQEPTRLDADDPLRDRFVFCGRITDRGHGRDCAWQAALALLASAAESDARGATTT
jgi:hypothetical protein